MFSKQAARDEVAKLIAAKSADVVPVTNATEAANVVINSISLSKKDYLLMTNLTYPAVWPINYPDCAVIPTHM
jgi:selenocysteine lyase/cysteine desulfurase